MSEKLLEHPLALCNAVRRIALEAGELTLEYFDESGYDDAQEKEDGTPVTEADQVAEAFIEKALSDLLPDVPMLGEEAVEAGRIPDLSQSDYFWCVDALDGTKEFIFGSGDYTVNIALIRDRKPVLGVVYAPVRGALYAGAGPGSAVRWLEDTDIEKPIHVRKAPAEGLTIVASRSHSSGDKLDDFLKDYKVAKLIKRGSSLKICTIAAGKADMYPRLGPTCEWDIAAGHAVLEAAGGRITGLDGSDFLYRKTDEKFLNSEFIAFGDAQSAA